MSEGIVKGEIVKDGIVKGQFDEVGGATSQPEKLPEIEMILGYPVAPRHYPHYVPEAAYAGPKAPGHS